ncbi:MAG: anti-sigma factor family protein [Cyanophyceae cyanobacterium]
MKKANHSHQSQSVSNQFTPWESSELKQDLQPISDGGDAVPFEQFELVSAYLDNEVTAEERLQVERWLAADPKIQALYVDLGGIGESLKQAPVPIACSAEETLAGVMGRVQKRQVKRRIWSGSVIAAGLAVAVGSVFVGLKQPGMQFAQNAPGSLESSPTSSLQIASSPGPSDELVNPGAVDAPILERALILE